jgi:hypothetical protein
MNDATALDLLLIGTDRFAQSHHNFVKHSKGVTEIFRTMCIPCA